MTPAEKSLRARAAAHSLHARVSDPAAHTAPARRAFRDRFEREVDPDGVLPPEERARRAEHAQKAYFAKLAFASAKARRARANPAAPRADRPQPRGVRGAAVNVWRPRLGSDREPGSVLP